MERKKLDLLAKEIMVCDKCVLAKTRNKVVFGEGAGNAKILFVGEAPGKNEDLVGRPFVGSAGRFLDQFINQLTLKRKDVYISNIVKCRPPGNRKPSKKEIEKCLPYLKRQIALINPKIVVLLGNIAIHNLLDKKMTSMSAHGTFYKKDNRVYFVTYHPATALYVNKLKKVMVEDFKNLKSLL